VISLRLWKQKPNNASGGDLELGNLIAEIGAFTPEQRAAAARGLAMLWEACLGRFGGLDGFLEADPVDRAAYLEDLRSAADRMEVNEALLRSRYALAPKLMVLYLESLLRGGWRRCRAGVRTGGRHTD
jgi:hypothetical protein